MMPQKRDRNGGLREEEVWREGGGGRGRPGSPSPARARADFWSLRASRRLDLHAHGVSSLRVVHFLIVNCDARLDRGHAIERGCVWLRFTVQ